MDETKVTTEEFAYMAGIVDGEGSVSIIAAGAICHVLVLSVANTSLRPLHLLQVAFGGRIYAVKRVPALRGGLRKQNYVWFGKNARAARALKELAPFMRIKGQQALVGLEFNDSRLASITAPDQRRFGRRSPETWDRHEEFRRRIMDLNGAHQYKRLEMREPKKYLPPRDPEERAAYIAAWRDANPEKVREYSQRAHTKRRDVALEEARAWKAANKDRVKEYDKQWRDKNREHVNAKQRENYKARQAKKAAAEAKDTETTVH